MVKNIQNKPLKKILIIAYGFPPVGGGRVRRVVKFIKYLPQFGWQPVILTAKSPFVLEYDKGLLKELDKGIKVYRTKSIELAAVKNISLENTLRGNGFIRSFILALAKKFKWWLCVPDSRIGWIPFALWSGFGIIKKESVDVILVTGEPFSSFITGALLKWLTRKPLVLDFRDEWVGFNKYYFPEKSKLVMALEEKLEAFTINKADKVISVTDEIINNFRKSYPREDKDKFICITNGFDPQDYAGIITRKDSGKFIISYAGTLYSRRTPEYLLRAIELILKESPDLRNKVILRFIGEVDNRIKPLFEDRELKSVIEVLGFLPFIDTINKLAESDLFVYIEDQVEISERILPAKLFDYLALRRPILALGKSDFLSEIIRKANVGIVVAPDNVKLIKNALFDFIYKDKNVEIDESYIQQFDRRNLTAKLSVVLNSLYI